MVHLAARVCIDDFDGTARARFCAAKYGAPVPKRNLAVYQFSGISSNSKVGRRLTMRWENPEDRSTKIGSPKASARH